MAEIHFSAITCYVFVVFLSLITTSVSIDTITASRSITSNESLISPQNRFELGLFSPGSSKRSYFGIWFNINQTQIVWIANRDNPLNNTIGVLRIGNDGNLILMDEADKIVWSTDVRNISSKTTVAQLLDSGNLVLRDSNQQENIIWQSFDHPSHALLPGMKLGWDLRTGLNRKLTSWKDSDDPSPGEYTHGFDLRGLPQITIFKGDSKHFRSGPWNGVTFGELDYQANLRFTTEAIINSEEVYYVHRLFSNSTLMMSALSYSGTLQLFIMDNSSNNWLAMFVLPQDYCGYYGFCGPNAICTISDARACSCMIGYRPKNSQDWEDRVWSGGCVRETPLNCSEDRHFQEIPDLKMPDFLQFKVNTSMSLEECKAECLNNCSCTAYANSNATGEGRYGCLLWFGDLIDVIKLPTPRPANQKLFIRFGAADLVTESNSKKKKKLGIIIMVMIASSILLLSIALFFIWKRKSQLLGRIRDRQQRRQVRKENAELPCFDIITITRATQNFSDTNKIGEGGFGPVYKGTLPTGQEIAIKRLSQDSSQGLQEFKNEIMLIAKLQHRNLVRLLGYCIRGEQRMLVYEYMPNGSLDSYIFGAEGDSSRVERHLLAWNRRWGIIVGIARGLLYLHRDSRLRIIHRDLKASNVLLDSEMNPKISDFGMARAFGEEQSRVHTKMIAGTYGYMSPEYAIDGIYSMKSDIFSFGVLVLEIVTGKRNNQFYHPEHYFNLLGHAWKLWQEGRGIELIDPLMEDSFLTSDVLRCIQVGLLCVQQRPEDRPTMTNVLLMLDTESVTLPQPKHPGYYTERVFNNDKVYSPEVAYSTNDLTTSMVHGR